MEDKIIAAYVLSTSGQLRESIVLDPGRAPRVEALGPLLVAISNTFSKANGSHDSRRALLSLDEATFSDFDVCVTSVSVDTAVVCLTARGFGVLANILLKRLKAAISLFLVEEVTPSQFFS